MCTFTLAWRVLPDAPVAVAANRDESLERPSTPPQVYRTSPTVVAPRDGEAGGTWIGVNEHGLVAGVTNRWTDRDRPGERSRGHLVADVLACPSAGEAADLVEDAVERHDYAGFYLVVADAERARCFGWAESLEERSLSPGVHVLVNVGMPGAVDVPAARSELGAAQAANARAVERSLAVEPDEGGSGWLDRAAAVLGDHGYGVCIHRDGFGTRSSSLIATGDTPVYRFADGPPCETAFEPVDIEGHI